MCSQPNRPVSVLIDIHVLRSDYRCSLAFSYLCRRLVLDTRDEFKIEICPCRPFTNGSASNTFICTKFTAFKTLTVCCYVILNLSNFFQVTDGMHSVNAVLLLIDTLLNNMVRSHVNHIALSFVLIHLVLQLDLCIFQPFPWYRIAFFVFWSCSYVTFQWVLHASGALSWQAPPVLTICLTRLNLMQCLQFGIL